jgi:hypothetical protein
VSDLRAAKPSARDDEEAYTPVLSPEERAAIVREWREARSPEAATGRDESICLP